MLNKRQEELNFTGRSIIKTELTELADPSSENSKRYFPNLMAELVAGHPQDHQPLGGVPLVELVHLGVIPGGRPSEGRHVLYENNLPLKRREIKNLPCQEFGREVVEGLCHG